MTDLDREIEEALNAEDRELHKQLGEQGIYAQWFSVYRGPQAWISIVTTIVMVVLFGVGVYGILQFHEVGFNSYEHVLWAAFVFAIMVMISFLKVWFWIRMEANRVIREIKRVELQVARISRDR